VSHLDAAIPHAQAPSKACVYSIPVGSAFLLTFDHKAPLQFGIDRGPPTPL
jgi:hypothetical protein